MGCNRVQDQELSVSFEKRSVLDDWEWKPLEASARSVSQSNMCVTASRVQTVSNVKLKKLPVLLMATVKNAVVLKQERTEQC